ncbi:MAG: ribonuclease R [Clostridiales bacterium]|nr:ribonuclease R [Clostridiales bacterium]
MNENLRIGIIQKNRKKFGFVRMEEGRDIYISPENLHTAMDGDEVAVELIPEIYWKGGPEGIITKVIKRNTDEIVGTLYKHSKYSMVVPNDTRINEEIYVLNKNIGKAKHGDIVVANVTQFPGIHENATGEVVEIVARSNQDDAAVLSLIRQYGLKLEFPKEVIDEAKMVTNQKINSDIASKRKDLRSLLTVTIDGKDSKDFDDAVTVEKLESGNHLLYVHIADVNHYVEPDDNLDKEALKRGNSVYLYDKVIPMLPEQLSNGMCSLKPKEDRLTITCKMEIDSSGKVVDYNIFESIINSDERLVYDDVSDILENSDKKLSDRYKEILNMLLAMKDLAFILRKKRKDHGSLDFNMQEANIILDKKGFPKAIELDKRRIANKIIEEFMLIANETVAEHFYWMECPFVFRVHDKPELDRMKELRGFLSSFGITISNNFDSIKPKNLSDILKQIEGKPQETIINRVILRMMKKAEYSPECYGHYGLAIKYYCHFTSPIRRYPDLMVHRIIKENLNNPNFLQDIKSYADKVEEVSKISSDTEKIAVELERKVEKFLKVIYMKDKVGLEYEGIISGIGRSGMFVELPNTVEGFVKYEGITGDYYVMDEKNYRAVGANSGKTLSIGDNVKVVVDKVNEQDRMIDFKIRKN